ncbi:hypothetical protein MIZ03_0627 [Rhodoferax lithotrophicus]|uniref:Uncharacterized protein n=1 Tax=Rhodoferax lithotrophicus TaxID=2798804 RepID=A0ABM7MHP0_9BURK|nr:hypothetical protein MIZ03_0627 [Rhodoferax sp. MIZ03]
MAVNLKSLNLMVVMSDRNFIAGQSRWIAISNNKSRRMFTAA